jgi:hypothetical protein
MLNTRIFISAVLLLWFFTSCSTQEVAPEIKSFELSKFELNLAEVTDFGKLYPLLTDVSTFYKKNHKELDALPDNIKLRIIHNKNGSFFTLEIDEDNQTKNQTEGEFLIEDCRTCTNAECVADALKEAIGDGLQDVDITYRNQRTLGMRTGVKVCWTYIQEGN